MTGGVAAVLAESALLKVLKRLNVRNESPTEAKEVGTFKAALISVGNPGQSSAAAMQCLAEFGIYHDLQVTPQEAHHVTLCPQWKIVLNAMI